MLRTASFAAVALLAACQMLPRGGPSASATLDPTKGNNASGSATFRQTGDAVRVVADVQGLNPGQQHGFHIHEAGDCSSGDGMSAKGHFNPQGAPHGDPLSGAHHAGDLPALRADSNGRAHVDVTLSGLTVAAGPNSVVGRGLIVHAQPDDYRTQPTGNSGARIACGVIK
jgi:Cu-Zn family superoxide dismutase